MTLKRPEERSSYIGFLPFSFKLNCVPFPKFIYWSPNSQHNFIWRWSLQEAAVVVQLLSVSSSLWPHELQHSRLLCPSVSCSLLKLMSIELMMSCNQSHPLSSTSPSALSLSQHQGFSNEFTLLKRRPKLLELQLQYFQWIFRLDFLSHWWVWSPCCPKCLKCLKLLSV